MAKHCVEQGFKCLFYRGDHGFILHLLDAELWRKISSADLH